MYDDDDGTWTLSDNPITAQNEAWVSSHQFSIPRPFPTLQKGQAFGYSELMDEYIFPESTGNSILQLANEIQ